MSVLSYLSLSVDSVHLKKTIFQCFQMSFCSTSVAQTVSRYIYNSEWSLLSKIMNTLIVFMFSTHTQADS